MSGATTTAEKASRASTVTQSARRGELFRSPAHESFFRPAKPLPFIQPRLEVSKPDDPHEREAEQTAHRVMTMPEPAPAVATPPSAPPPDQLQRRQEHEEHEHEEIQAKSESSGAIQCNAEPGGSSGRARVCSTAALPGECSGTATRPIPLAASLSRVVHRRHISLFRSDVVQRAGRGPPARDESFEAQLSQTKGTGRELPGATRSFMENRFQSDFSGVRVHTGSSAQSLSKSIHAQAFTHGGDIYFNSGKYDPDSSSGRTLLAHELTHTVQQGASPAKPISSATAPTASSAATGGISRSVVARKVIQRQAAVPQLAAAVAKAKGEQGKVNADKPGPDGFRTGWERLLEYFKTSMGPDKIVSGTGGGGYVPGTVSEQVIKTKSQALGQVANQPPDVTAMRDAMPSWCGIFVFWALNKGGVPMPKWTLGGPAMKREAVYPPGRTPTLGDIAYRQNKSHYAIVESATGGGGDADITTMNGNTAGEDNLGGQVQSHTHKISNWTGFFNPLVLMEGS
ncbi:MAG TPA: DUF4157 domain-containing protein, partial [Verrucomicrobiae bacterium]|nr:DUF4157 domain-containing protein [Verrucomicrobiae bacterium]